MKERTWSRWELVAILKTAIRLWDAEVSMCRAQGFEKFPALEEEVIRRVLKDYGFEECSPHPLPTWLQPRERPLPTEVNISDPQTTDDPGS